VGLTHMADGTPWFALADPLVHTSYFIATDAWIKWRTVYHGTMISNDDKREESDHGDTRTIGSTPSSNTTAD